MEQNEVKIEDMVPVNKVIIAEEHPELSIQDIKELCETYDPKTHEAPVCPGHPEDNKPVCGWIKRIWQNGTQMLADMVLAPSFKEMVEKGYYKKRSISLYENFRNTGKKVLRHLGFVPIPEIKGMPDISFSEDKEGGEFRTVEFSEENDWKFNQIADILQNLRDWLIEQYGTEKANQIVSTWALDDLKRKIEEADGQSSLFSEIINKELEMKETEIVKYSEDQVNSLVDAAVKKKEDTMTAEFAEERHDWETKVAILEQEKEAAEQRATSFSERITTLENEKVELEVTNFVETQISKGKIPPAEKDEEIVNLSEISVERRKARMELIESRKPLIRFDGPNPDVEATHAKDYSENPNQGDGETGLREKEKGIFPDKKEKEK